VRLFSVRFAAALFVSATGLTLMMNSSAFAEGCMATPAKLSDPAIGSFTEAPGALLARHPTGGPAMSNEVRRLAASEVNTVPQLIELAKDAKPEHIVGLGIGLAQAAGICAKTKSELSDLIKKLVSESGNIALAAAFSAESTLVALAPERCDPQSFVMGDPPNTTAHPTGNEQSAPQNSEEPQTIAAELGIGQSGFLYPFTFGKEFDLTTPRRPKPAPGGGGLVATTGDVVSPTR
jgi:hypothetical protein